MEIDRLSFLKDIQSKLNTEIAKHRKLLNRATGNRCVVSINWHHMNIVRLIKEAEKNDKLIRDEIGPVFGLLHEDLAAELWKKLDDQILNGDGNENRRGNI